MSDISQISRRAAALTYEADLLGNIRQVLAGLQGYDTMALELLQNADDAGATEIRFDIRSDFLRVRHNSQFSSCGLQDEHCPWPRVGNPRGGHRPCDFHSVSLMAAHGKAREAGQIGRFGIGFVSVYQITDTPIIRSTGTELRLDPITRRNTIADYETGEWTEVELPWARSKSEIRRALNQTPVPNDVGSELEAALRRAVREGLLFLRHLTRVEIARSGSLISLTTVERLPAEGRTFVRTDADVDEWLVLSGEARLDELEREFEALAELKRSPTVQIAFPVGPREALAGRLYAFLPTGQASRLPCHINGDFFPRQDRRSIITSGGGHQPRFNSLLLRTAAETIAGAVQRLKAEIGYLGLWDLLEAAYGLEKEEPDLTVFWTKLAEAARQADIAFTSAETWAPIAESALPPVGFSAEEETAAAAVGLPIIHAALRPRRNVLQKLGARQLTLTRLVDVLDSAEAEDEILPALWTTMQRLMVEGGADQENAKLRLTQLSVFLDVDGDRTTLAAVYRPPTVIVTPALRRIAPEAPFISDRLCAFPEISALIDEIAVDDVAFYLAKLTTDEQVRARFSDTRALRDLFDVLAQLPCSDDQRAEVCATLQSTPLLPSDGELLPPARARWPGGFNDPVGHFRLVDSTIFSEVGGRFVREVLDVGTLTFRAYLEEHLDEILGQSLSREGYQALLRQLLAHEVELAKDDGLELLRAARLCRTVSGDFVQAGEAYERTEENEALLGADGTRWIDIGWLPTGYERDATLALFRRMDLGAKVAVRHLVERIRSVTGDKPTPAARNTVGIIVRHLLQHWETLTEAEREDLEKLREAAWLPAALRREPDLEQWRRPKDVQQPFFLDLIYSQLPVVDVQGLRGSGAGRAFLDFFGVPTEAPTGAIVRHLLWCAAERTPPSENVYVILQQRLERDGGSDLEPLRGTDCIYLPGSGAFRSAETIFWNPPPFGLYWSKAGSFQAARFPLFSFLGVCDEPQPRHYAALLRRLVAENPGGLAGRPHDELVHAGCVAHLAAGVSEAASDARDALKQLADIPFLLSSDKRFVRPSAVVWRDAPQFAEPFGPDLLGMLVEPLPDRAAGAALYRYLGVEPLSAVARLVIVTAENPRPDEHASTLLAERAPWLAWLAPSARTADRIARSLGNISVMRVDSLSQRAELPHEGTAIVSPPAPVNVFFDAEDATLFIRAGEEAIDWSEVFATVLPLIFGSGDTSDLPALVLGATLVLTASAPELAERYLVKAGFRAHADDFEDGAQEIEDAGSWESGADLWDDEPWEETREDAPSGSDSPSSGFCENADGDEVGGDPTNADIDLQDNDRDQGGGGRQSGQHDRGAKPSQPRTSRFLTYVGPARSGPGTTSTPAADEHSSNPIDEAAMSAVMAFEVKEGRRPERQSHTNPGFDIISTEPDGARRWIEVKGLESEWSGRGVKMTRTQFETARLHGDAFWLYVVEQATDGAEQKIHAIRNPFLKVEDYFFDHGWRDVVEKTVAGRTARLAVGARVRHAHFGLGTVEKVSPRGLVTDLVIDFRHNGRKALPLSASIEILND